MHFSVLLLQHQFFLLNQIMLKSFDSVIDLNLRNSFFACSHHSACRLSQWYGRFIGRKSASQKIAVGNLSDSQTAMNVWNEPLRLWSTHSQVVRTAASQIVNWILGRMKNAHSRFNLIVVIVALTRCQHTQARVAEITFFVVNLFVNGKNTSCGRFKWMNKNEKLLLKLCQSEQAHACLETIFFHFFYRKTMIKLTHKLRCSQTFWRFFFRCHRTNGWLFRDVNSMSNWIDESRIRSEWFV